MDGRAVSLPVDSASTSKEICNLLANKIKLTDKFGFSLYVTLYEKVQNIHAIHKVIHIGGVALFMLL